MNHQDLIKACQSEWHDYTQHPFVEQLANGELAPAAYLHYLKQDFLFLIHYARAYALGVYKAQNLEQMRRVLPSLHALLDTEIAHHVSYCEQWGLTEADMQAESEDFGTVAYTRYVLDTGLAGDICELFVALAPCSIGYAQIGAERLNSADTVLEGNAFRSWVEMYGSEEFQDGVATGAEFLDQLLADIELDSPRGQRLCEIFRTATRMEVAFWQQGLDAA
ncbi:thiaminase II [Aliagarivorans marinus]|uniref:thiaminase II n=1 Tax=Aliagarivorans marinus TaxID=561965 RepID=UPI00041F5DA7|nr:thiaminase II [Aliagarivorans marinus]